MGFLDFMFGGKEEQENPMRHWAMHGPTAVSNYYDSAILDAQKQTGQYWGIWTAQMQAVDNMFKKSTSAWNQQYNATRNDLLAQQDELNRWHQRQTSNVNSQYDNAIQRITNQANETKENIRDQEKSGQASLQRKKFSSGLIGTTAGKNWSAGLEDRANEAVGDVDTELNNAVTDYESQRTAALSQIDDVKINTEDQFTGAFNQLASSRATGLADIESAWAQMLINTLGGAPIGADPSNELQFRKAQELYGTPWEQYAQPIVTETPGMFQEVLMPALGAAIGGGLGTGISGSLLGGLGLGGGQGGGGLGGLFSGLLGGGQGGGGNLFSGLLGGLGDLAGGLIGGVGDLFGMGGDLLGGLFGGGGDFMGGFDSMPVSGGQDVIGGYDALPQTWFPS